MSVATQKARAIAAERGIRWADADVYVALPEPGAQAGPPASGRPISYALCVKIRHAAAATAGTCPLPAAAMRCFQSANPSSTPRIPGSG